jgi:hypothetical protein
MCFKMSRVSSIGLAAHVSPYLVVGYVHNPEMSDGLCWNGVIPLTQALCWDLHINIRPYK